MNRVRIAGPARRDILKIIEYTNTEFGTQASRRYRKLIEQALSDLADDHTAPGVKPIDDVREGYFVYHLQWSRNRPSSPRVRRPRHLIAFFIDAAGDIIVARVFHERQMLARHLTLRKVAAGGGISNPGQVRDAELPREIRSQRRIADCSPVQS